MMGRVGDRQPHEPVTWTNVHTGGGRVFYTSLGHPEEFQMPVFRRLLVQGIYWAAGQEIPAELADSPPQPQN
jgi:type 1 glutamine amidotransferase